MTTREFYYKVPVDGFYLQCKPYWFSYDPATKFIDVSVWVDHDYGLIGYITGIGHFMCDTTDFNKAVGDAMLEVSGVLDEQRTFKLYYETQVET